MKTSDFDYILPEENIAQYPSATRDECKMLVMDRTTGALSDRIFRDILEYIQPGDVLIANETRVMPARLLGTKKGTGGAAEIFLLREDFSHCSDKQTDHLKNEREPFAQAASSSLPLNTLKDESVDSAQLNSVEEAPLSPNTFACWEALVRPGKRLKPGAIIEFADADGKIMLEAEIIDWVKDAERGERLVRLSTPSCASLDEAMHRVGHTPLPPYIKNYTGNEELYQTVFSQKEKSAAAPTAGLHFTSELIERIKQKGAFFETVELEVGLDTFRIVDEEDPEKHHIHTEFYTVPQPTVDAVNAAHERGNRVIAVGTTSVRSLESAWDTEAENLLARNREATSLYLLPGSTFHVVDALITNFHVPRSTLMMLVSAFSSRENIMAAYHHAIEKNYRLLSFGDAMFITDLPSDTLA